MKAMAALVLGVLVAAHAGGAHAEPPEARLGLAIRSPVPRGQRPAVVVAPTEGVRSLRIEVLRGGRRVARKTWKNIARGERHELPLRQRDERAHYEARFDVAWRIGGHDRFKIAFDALVLPPLRLELRRDLIDIDHRRLAFRTNRPPAKAEVVVRGEGGTVLGRGEQTWDEGAAAKPPYEVRWDLDEDAPVRRIDLKVTDRAGFWATAEVRTFYVEPWVDHIEFDFGKATIRPDQRPKLDATLQRIRKAYDTARKTYGDSLDFRLYIAGYTDTVGTPKSNLALSEARALAIARYFRAHGLRIPMFYQGFGESVLAVPTPDDTPEPRNRRTVYVISSQAPRGSLFPRAHWKRLR